MNFKFFISSMNGHSNYVLQASKTLLCHWSERIPTQYQIRCHGLT